MQARTQVCAYIYGGICVEQMRINTGSSAPGARSARARRGRPWTHLMATGARHPCASPARVRRASPGWRHRYYYHVALHETGLLTNHMPRTSLLNVIKMVDRIRSRALDQTRFFNYVKQTVRDLTRYVRQSQDQDTIDNAIFRIETIMLNAIRLEPDIPSALLEEHGILRSKLQVSDMDSYILELQIYF